MGNEDETRRGFLPLSGPGHAAPEPPVIEDYEIVKLLGKGGMGAVWQAKQLSTDRAVALKVMSPGLFRSEDRARIRFEREVTLAARLEHPNIARIYESGIHKNHYFYAMELIHGRILSEYVQQQKLPTQGILQLMYKVCQAVQYAHQNGIIHRDLKHSNIMVTPDGQPHVLDFGLARDLFSQDRGRHVSLDGDVVGTPEFMSPEQAAGDIDAVDTRSDAYSLGVILYDLLLGRLPYDLPGQYYWDLKMIQEEEPARPSSLIPRFDRDLEAILLKTLLKEPSERYRSAGELADDIDNWLNNRPISIKSLNTIYVLKKLLSRHRYSAAVLTLLIVVVLSFMFIIGYLYNQTTAANKKTADAGQQVRAQNRLLAQNISQVMFIHYLDALSRRDFTKMQQMAYVISVYKGSKECLGLKYLQRSKQDESVEAAFQVGFPDGQEWFVFLVIAEAYFQKGENKKALNYYRQTHQALVTDHSPVGTGDMLYIRLVESRLYELSQSAPTGLEDE